MEGSVLGRGFGASRTFGAIMPKFFRWGGRRGRRSGDEGEGRNGDGEAGRDERRHNGRKVLVWTL